MLFFYIKCLSRPTYPVLAVLYILLLNKPCQKMKILEISLTPMIQAKRISKYSWKAARGIRPDKNNGWGSHETQESIERCLTEVRIGRCPTEVRNNLRREVTV